MPMGLPWCCSTCKPHAQPLFMDKELSPWQTFISLRLGESGALQLEPSAAFRELLLFSHPAATTRTHTHTHLTQARPSGFRRKCPPEAVLSLALPARGSGPGALAAELRPGDL
ncbi:Mbt Domain-Containing Protein 1 [Manis pentadactyla]|nr:Mbt Domain-Containing Protein 1 [Manis pentadactyla]